MWYAIGGVVLVISYFTADEVRLHVKHFGTWPKLVTRRK